MKVFLQKWSVDYKEQLARLCNGADRTYLTGRIPHPYTIDNAVSWLCMAAEREGKDGLFRAVVADGNVVGNITVERLSDIYSKDARLGYVIDNAFCGRGIATEATRLIIEEAFSVLDIVRLSSEVFAPNVASRRVLEKNGFVLEGLLKKAAYKDGKFFDLCRYALLKDGNRH